MTISNTSSPLLKDAIVEAKKLREVATAEATNALVKAVSPLVKKMVEEEISGKTKTIGSGIILEQEGDEPTEEVTPPAAPAAMPGSDPMAAATPDPLAAGADPLGGSPGQAGAVPPLDAPLSPPMSSPTDMPGLGGVATPPAPMPPEAAPVAAPASASVPMPGQDGTITVDLGSLYVQTPPGTDPVVSEPALSATPSPEETAVSAPAGGETPPAGEEDLGFPMLEGKGTSELSVFRLAIKETKKLINLVEQAIPQGAKPSQEVVNSLSKKLERLYEANQGLPVDPRDKKINAFILENLYKKLSLLESGKNENTYVQKQKEETLDMKKVKTIREFAASLLEADLKTGSTTPKGSAGFGDGGTVASKESSTKEADSKSNAMKDAARSKGTKGGKDVEDPEKGGVTTLEEALEGDSELAEAFGLGGEKKGPLEEGEDAAMEETIMEVDETVAEEGLKESLHKKLLALREQAAAVQKQLSECGMEEGMGNPNEPVKVTVTVSGNADVDVVDDNDMDQGDEGDVELHFDDEPEGDDDLDLGSSDEDEDDLALSDDDTETLKENKKLRAELAETRLVTARSLYINKVFANHELSTKQKQVVVEHLDKAKTIKEAKALYGRIAAILEKKAQTTAKFAGSTSRATRPGGASLNESAGQSQPKSVMDLSATSERWMKLAGIPLPKSGK